MLTARKLKELQGPKSRSRPLPSDAMLPQNEMCFRCTVLEKCHQNFRPHKLHGGDLYQIHLLITPHWKVLCS